ncbi:hypothetical protein EG329_014478 [Mollisiaceae sp. DMI_Dod_QoI]|nr:hypothetical protein EG329_014478 [Helotiales sp. DMI_Dod_QoI]
MEDSQHTHAYVEDDVTDLPRERTFETPYDPPISRHHPYIDSMQSASEEPYTSRVPAQIPSNEPLRNERFANKYEPTRPTDFSKQKSSRLNKKWQRRLYWIVPLGIVALVLVILFEVYKDDFERWVSPLTKWLRDRESWSWVIPTVILIILSFPPLFGHEIVQIIVGLAFPLGVAIGIACAGAVLGEAACFIVFKYGFTWWVEKKIAEKVSWAATARVAQEAGFRGVLVIRYSIVPPHLANPLFSCTGMKFWLYMVTVLLSLPKSMVFVALGAPTSKNSKAAKYGKVIAVAVVVAVTVFASIWIRKKMSIATKQIEAERNIAPEGDEELGMLTPSLEESGTDDISYKGAATPYRPYQGTPAGSQPHQNF